MKKERKLLYVCSKILANVIIGGGLLAKAFKDYDYEDVVFFASGVSNSLETRKEEFLLEKTLLQETIAQHNDKTIIYFSTCSIYDPSKSKSLYVQHKLEMESIIKNGMGKKGSFFIIRVSNAVGHGGNPNLLLNYACSRIKNNLPLTIYTKANRNLIDVEDVRNITINIFQNHSKNTVINVAYLHQYNVKDVVAMFENHIGFSTQNYYVENGSFFDIPIVDLVRSYFLKNNKEDKNKYLRELIEKYY